MFSATYEQLIHEDPVFPIIFHNDQLSMNQLFFMHWHENIELLYFREGKAVVYCDTVPIPVSAGSLVIVNTGALHTIESVTPICRYDCLIVDKIFLDGFGMPVDGVSLQSLVTDETVGSHFDRINFEMSEKPPYYKPAVKAEALALFARLYRIAKQPIAAGRHGSRQLDMVRSALSYIRQHYREELTVDDICRHIGFSKYYFCRVFRKITGKTVIDTINFLRCNHAKSLLSSGRCNVSESAEQSGFHNLSYFSKTYKKYIGTSPSELVSSGLSDQEG